MYKIISFFFIAFLAFAFSCSSYQVARAPAEKADTFPEEAFETSMSFAFSEKKTRDLDLEDELPKHQNKEFVLDSSLEKTTAFRIEIKDASPAYRIHYAPNALDDTQALAEVYAFIEQLNKKFSNRSSSVELYLNAKAKDLLAIETLLEIKEAVSPESRSLIQGLKSELKLRIKELKVNRTHEKTMRKMALQALDKLPEDEQFLNFVARGDRQGAANLIRAYLPWEEMAPVEKHFWETYLKTVISPAPLKDRVLVYRGLYQDPIYSSMVNGKKLSTKEAVLQGKAFMMSPLMIKNQGSWNRRLRSLEAINKKFIGGQTPKGEVEPKAHNARISVMFANHASEPKGSPFLSFTPDFYEARLFGDHRTAAYLIDPRLLNSNYANPIKEEMEFLLPLTTFPDELVGISYTGEHKDRKNYLNERLKKIISDEYGQDKAMSIIERINANTAHFFDEETKAAHDEFSCVDLLNLLLNEGK